MSSSPIVYSVCGLRLRSEIEVDLPIVDSETYDVDVVRGTDLDGSAVPQGDVIASYEIDDTAWYTAATTESGYVLRFRDVGEFAVSADLSVIRVHRDPAGRVELLPILLAGTVCAFVLTLRGHTVLHASAVAVDGRAIAFVGQSGRGKSTLAALLCADGAELITDDVLAVAGGTPATCVGGASALRLRANAAPIAEQRPDHSLRVTADDRLAYAPPAAASGPVPLAAVVVPCPSRDADEVTVRTLSPADGVVALLSFPRVHGWRRGDVLSRDFTVFSQLVSTVPVVVMTIPWGPPFDPSVVGALRAVAGAT